MKNNVDIHEKNLPILNALEQIGSSMYNEYKEKFLIKEAKRRGFKNGVKYKDIDHRYTYYCEEYFEQRDGQLMCTFGGGWIFKDGKWAEIINDPTKDKIAELEATINKAQQELKELKGLVD